MADLTAIGSFSGCGGSSLGYKRAGFDVRVAIEIDPIAAQTYESNHPETMLLRSDIRLIDGTTLLRHADVAQGELHLWEGSPPCSKFSISGKRAKGWNATTAADSEIKLRNVEDLFLDWIRLLREMQPMTAVAENVPALAIGVARGKLHQFVETIRDSGYRIRVWVLPAERYGLPQKRHRLFIVCVRADLDDSMLEMPTSTTSPQGYGAAIADLPTVHWHPPFSRELPSEHHAPFMRGQRIEPLWEETEIGNAHPIGFNLKRPHPDHPSNTVTSFDGNIAANGLMHGLECRRFSVAELKRICGFPDDYVLHGSYKDRVGRLGNAVPPILAQAVGQQVALVLRANLGMETR